MDRLSKHFTKDELKCPCCHQIHLHKEFLNELERLREIVGLPFIINSCCRCKEHNIEVGGANNSYHIMGENGTLAIDISTKDWSKKDRELLIFHSVKRGWSIGFGETFLHIDMRILTGANQTCFWYD